MQERLFFLSALSPSSQMISFNHFLIVFPQLMAKCKVVSTDYHKTMTDC